MYPSISFSEKLADVMVMAGFAFPAVVSLVLSESSPDPQAPATKASTSRIAPTAPARFNRMGLWSSLSLLPPGRSRPQVLHRRRLGHRFWSRDRAREDGDPSGLVRPRRPPHAGRGEALLHQTESEFGRHRDGGHDEGAGE